MLASVAAGSVNWAVLLTRAGVGHITLLAAAEEALAPLTGDDPVVDPRRLVPTDLARDHFNLGWKREREVSPECFSGFHYHEPGLQTQVYGAPPFFSELQHTPLHYGRGSKV